MLTKARIILLALAVAALAAVPSAALARHGADDPLGDDHGGRRGDDRASAPAQSVAGSCTDGSTSKLKVKPDDGRLALEFEVDQNRKGVVWTVRIRRDGVLVVRRNAATHPPSGSFEIHKKITNTPGPNDITARAESPSGEVCTAALTI
jgi:hypothetical protein